MTRYFRCVLILLVAAMLVLPAAQVRACVGKTLMVGTSGTVQQDVLAQMLALLISERTGTTVKVVQFDSSPAAHQALLRADLDMYVEYTGVGQVTILQQSAISDADELYKSVKSTYNEQLNLIWLKPLGFDESRVAPEGSVAQAAPVVRKDTLKKFPALARLINKLGGKVDDETIADLEKQAAQDDARKVARQFLRDNRLI